MARPMTARISTTSSPAASSPVAAALSSDARQESDRLNASGSVRSRDSQGLFPGVILDKDHSLPLYSQLEQLVRGKIRDNVLRPGDLLPSEKELKEHFGVSRVTVRTALQNLVRDGLIRRARGRGSEVNPPKIEVDLSGLEGFAEAMKARGFQVRTRVLNAEAAVAGEEVAEGLGVSLGAHVWHLERLRFVNDERMVHVHTYLPEFAGIPDGSSLYDFLRGRGLSPSRTEEFLEAVQADAVLATRLSVPAGQSLLRRVRRSQLADGRVVEYTVGHYRGDRYRYRFQLSRS